MKDNQRRSRIRAWRASLRDTRLLLAEFRIPLLAFLIALASSGILYHFLALNTSAQTNSISESIYLILTMTFLQPNGVFPTQWYLQIFYFLMPILGISILAQGLADFGTMFFNRKARGKEWEMAVASTFNNHVVLIGLGHLGYRVVQQLAAMEQDVVVITLNPAPDLVARVHEMGIPVIQDDGTRRAVLEAAGTARARAIILCTQNDSLNLQMALKARTLNPEIQVVIRIFDDDFASELQQQFGFRAFSATGMAAPVFASSAAGIDMTQPISIEGVPNSLARMQISPRSKLVKLTVDQIEDQYQVSIVMLCHLGNKNDHPEGHLKVDTGDILAILGVPERISLLLHDN